MFLVHEAGVAVEEANGLAFNTDKSTFIVARNEAKYDNIKMDPILIINNIKRKVSQLFNFSVISSKTFAKCADLAESFGILLDTTLVNTLDSFVYWIKPKPPYVKLNMDGVVDRENSGAGGLNRDVFGEILAAFAAPVLNRNFRLYCFLSFLVLEKLGVFWSGLVDILWRLQGLGFLEIGFWLFWLGFLVKGFVLFCYLALFQVGEFWEVFFVGGRLCVGAEGNCFYWILESAAFVRKIEPKDYPRIFLFWVLLLHTPYYFLGAEPPRDVSSVDAVACFVAWVEFLFVAV
ncbi:hypothetical protein KFK09_017809 [Dendrobium nobile]|uniref:Uncharacterized protein n=1 Tax=Dendrobium nobile TaxID=94219 RepID=A0A8T3AT24_DENNO|nr:hypothetical protein KFK09_017809 [Dendrobium nobile]